MGPEGEGREALLLVEEGRAEGLQRQGGEQREEVQLLGGEWGGEAGLRGGSGRSEGGCGRQSLESIVQFCPRVLLSYHDL